MLTINGYQAQDYEQYCLGHQDQVESQVVFDAQSLPGIEPFFWGGPIPEDARAFFILGQHHVSALRNDRFHNAIVTGAGIIFTADKQVLHGQVPVGGGQQQFLQAFTELELEQGSSSNAYHCPRLNKITKIPEAIVIARSATGNYHHILCDVAPRLHLVAEGLARAGAAVELATAPILISPGTPDWALGLLVNSSGISAERFLRIPKDGAYEVERLIVPHALNNFAHWVSPQTHAYYKPIYAWAKQHSTANYGPKIYTLRREVYQDRRRPHNQDEIAAKLERQGFAEVKPGQMSWADQIVAFHEAKYVVAGMGSNISNMLFSKPGARVLILHPNDSQYSLNVGMAAAGGQDIGYLWCECFSNPARGEHVEIYVDPVLLEDGIRALLAR